MSESKSPSRKTNATKHLCVEQVLNLDNTVTRLWVVMRGLSKLLKKWDLKASVFVFRR